ncbi:O-antigen ligase-like protein [Candidatus Planktophila limnetica]|uniref:O-antigen ligase-like protein n=1 Tax=Candidatus Planktophila limnetica TaxID=573600 RepID=A0A249LDN6_9ACTN|nr:O-antigen ligase family protein [Candidatus Planktophila limnetica]ASY27183.1 O-antigen ligase-like protein [Candidatus Planktophila limnetica]
MFLALIPLVLVSVGWFAHDPVSIFASSVLLAGVLIAVLVRSRGSWKKSWFLLTPIGLVLGYLVSAVVNGQGLAPIYLGGYQRNFGIATWLALTLVVLVCAQGEVKIRGFLDWILPSVLIAGLAYGCVQFLDQDPLPWTNPYKAVSLTLGNPNFAGAFFGILSVVAVSRIFVGKTSALKVFGVLLFAATVFISLKTKSLQSPLLIIGGILIFALLSNLAAKGRIGRITKLASGGVLGAAVIGIGVLFIGGGSFLATVREKLFFQGSVAQRLDYWRTGFEIWKDHPIFGVGADQFQRYAALYRTPEQLKRDGVFVIPDKSHNVLIDHFANGGLVVGVIWIAFVVSVFYMLLKSLKNNDKIQVRRDLALLGTMWSTYVLQALISPDQIVLSLIGYSSAGLIAGIYLKDAPTVKIDPFIVRSVTAFVLVLAVVISGKALMADANVKKVVNGQITGVEPILKVIDAWPNAKTTELIGIQEINKPNNCEFANQISDKLLKYDDRSAQGWYMKAICDNSIRNYDKAIEDINNSVKFDPINPSYLVGKAKLEIAASRIVDAKVTIAKITEVDPSNAELAALNSSVSAIK